MLLTDVCALLGIDLVLCSIAFGIVRPWLQQGEKGRFSRLWCVGLGLLFVGLWMPVGASGLPVLAYVRGIISDLSVTSVLLAGNAICRPLWPSVKSEARERLSVCLVAVLTAMVLYPTALGWGSWDAYRAGWGSPGFLGGLMLASLMAWFAGLRALPALLAAGVCAWAVGVLESNNLWDYLLDPWLTLWAIFWLCRAATDYWLRQRICGSVAANRVT